MNDKATKYYFRQRNRNRLYDVVVHAAEESAILSGTRRKDIAETLNIPPSQVTRLLSGPSNWECDTISDLLFAIGAELDYRVVFARDRVKSNSFHPVGETATQMQPIARRASTTTSESVSMVEVKMPEMVKMIAPGAVHAAPGWRSISSAVDDA